MENRPNILWLTYEDTSPQFVSAYGMTPVVTTPVMDTLAAEGVRFTNAYATAPVCSASRSAIITGCCNEATGLGHHRSKYPIPRELLRGFPRYLHEAGYYTTNNVKTDYNIEDERSFIDATWHESSNRAHWRGGRPGQPFFSVFNYLDSHQSRTMTRPWGWYEKEVLGRLAPGDTLAPETVAMPPIYRDTEEMRRHLSRVYNALRLCDRNIGARMAELQADGLLDDTIVFCFADHGEGLPRGKGNGIGFGYRAAFCIRFPPRYAHLSPWGTGTVTDELVSFEDLAPTVLSLAGVRVPEHMTGRALLGPGRKPPPRHIFAARNRLDDTPDLCRSAIDGRFVYTRNYFPHLPVVKYQKYGDVADIQRTIRRDYAAGLLDPVQAELVRPTRPTEYLYDLRDDPWEIHNLAAEPDYRADLLRLRAATREHAREIHDVMFLPEVEMVSRAQGSTPYERRADAGYNPLDELLEAAARVGGGAPAVPAQIAGLGHPHDAVRYWAAVGLYASRSHLAPFVEAIRPHLADPAAFVQVELAAALYGVCRLPEARETLSRQLENEDELIAHQALEKLLYMPGCAADFADAVGRVAARFEHDARPDLRAFPLQQALAMYRYLYRGEPLFYAADLPYLGEDRGGTAPTS